MSICHVPTNTLTSKGYEVIIPQQKSHVSWKLLPKSMKLGTKSTWSQNLYDSRVLFTFCFQTMRFFCWKICLLRSLGPSWAPFLVLKIVNLSSQQPNPPGRSVSCQAVVNPYNGGNHPCAMNAQVGGIEDGLKMSCDHGTLEPVKWYTPWNQQQKLLKVGRATKGKDGFPTIHFQVLCHVSFREGIPLLYLSSLEVMKLGRIYMDVWFT